MIGTFQIIHERAESFTGKRGKVEQHIVSLLDQSQHPMLNTVDYVLSSEERPKEGEKLMGRLVELAIANARIGFGGRLRLEGRILKLK